jgi:hypothetical protein
MPLASNSVCCCFDDAFPAAADGTLLDWQFYSFEEIQVFYVAKVQKKRKTSLDSTVFIIFALK